MITNRLILDCMAYDEAEYGKADSYDETYVKLQDLQDRGCIVEHCLHCPNCPKFGKECPIK